MYWEWFERAGELDRMLSSNLALMERLEPEVCVTSARVRRARGRDQERAGADADARPAGLAVRAPGDPSLESALTLPGIRPGSSATFAPGGLGQRFTPASMTPSPRCGAVAAYPLWNPVPYPLVAPTWSAVRLPLSSIQREGCRRTGVTWGPSTTAPPAAGRPDRE